MHATNFQTYHQAARFPGTQLLFHSSIRFKIERNCFNVVSLCRASFGIAIERKSSNQSNTTLMHRGPVYQFWPLRSQSLIIEWLIRASYIGACTYTRIIWCMHLYTKPPDHLQKWAVSYISACTWMRGNRVGIKQHRSKIPAAQQDLHSADRSHSLRIQMGRGT